MNMERPARIRSNRHKAERSPSLMLTSAAVASIVAVLSEVTFPGTLPTHAFPHDSFTPTSVILRGQNVLG